MNLGRRSIRPLLSRWGWVAAAVGGLLGGPARAQIPIAGDPIAYESATVADPIATMQAEVDRGSRPLAFEERHGYLKDVLKRLDVPISSQALVFSKTSFQYSKISPRSPRAIYFNDDVYVGWVDGGQLLEVASMDPKQGPIFYALKQEREESPAFERTDQNCLQCHVSARTKGVPGLLVRSVFTNPSGTQVGGLKSFGVGHETPFQERWGGWYVTGTHAESPHMGNVVVRDKTRPDPLDRKPGSDAVALVEHFDTGSYLSDHSDIVSQLVLAHQANLHNRITQTNYLARIDANSPDGSAPRGFEAAAEELLRYLLFIDEVPLNGPVAGTSGFAEEFAQRGPRDPQGRSLREFDLNRRLFKHPCSYLIYSRSFDALPPTAKDYLYKRIHEILTGKDLSPDFARLVPEERRAIFEILLATKPDLPDYWRSQAPPVGADEDASNP